jgi:hypothetical protein
MEPARPIDSIRVLDVAGLGTTGDGAAALGDPVRRVFDALLGTGAALPLLRELLSFAGKAGVDTSTKSSNRPCRARGAC